MTDSQEVDETAECAFLPWVMKLPAEEPDSEPYLRCLLCWKAGKAGESYVGGCKEWGMDHHNASGKKNKCKRRWQTSTMQIQKTMQRRVELERKYNLPRSNVLHEAYYILFEESPYLVKRNNDDDSDYDDDEDDKPDPRGDTAKISQLFSRVVGDISTIWCPYRKNIRSVGSDLSKSEFEILEERERHTNIKRALDEIVRQYGGSRNYNQNRGGGGGASSSIGNGRQRERTDSIEELERQKEELERQLEELAERDNGSAEEQMNTSGPPGNPFVLDGGRNYNSSEEDDEKMPDAEVDQRISSEENKLNLAELAEMRRKYMRDLINRNNEKLGNGHTNKRRRRR